MGDDDHGQVEGVGDEPDPLLDGFLDDTVKGAERLVEQKHLRLHDKRSGKRDPLFLAAGKLIRLFIQMLLQVEQADEIADLGLCRDFRFVVQAVDNVFIRSQVREETEILKNDIESAVFHFDISDILAVENQAAAGWLQNAEDDVEQRRFAASGRSEDGNDFAVAYIKADVFQYFFVIKCLGNVSDLKHNGHLLQSLSNQLYRHGMAMPASFM